MQSQAQEKAGSLTMTTTAPTAEALGQLWSDVDKLLRENSSDGRLVDALAAFNSWSRQNVQGCQGTRSSVSVTITKEEVPAVHVVFQSVKAEFEKIGKTSGGTAMLELIQEVTKNIQSLNEIRKQGEEVAAALAPQASTKSKHVFEENRTEGRAKAGFGDFIKEPGYNGPFSDAHHVYKKNLATDDARVRYGDQYGGKDVFDD